MSAPIRFLGLAIVAYVGLRTASSALALEPAAAEAPELWEGSDAALAAAEPTLPPGVPADMGPPAPARAAAMASSFSPPAAAEGYASPVAPLD